MLPVEQNIAITETRGRKPGTGNKDTAALAPVIAKAHALIATGVTTAAAARILHPEYPHVTVKHFTDVLRKSLNTAG